MPEPTSRHDPAPDEPPARTAPGGPYFGRLLAVLLLAVAFCGFMTWLLSTWVGE